ncbi:MAG: MFS transporter [Armatimonadota bacterium]|nr:MAG: MFS transporter [Armatimonadota bacterium]
MNRNVKTLLAVSVLFGAATGGYEFVLPYYLDEQGLSYQNMGTVFAVAAAGMFLLRVMMGRLADIWGRKPFYGLSLGGSAVAMWLTPLSGSVVGQALLKTVREAMLLTRETLHPVALYEEGQRRFLDFMGKTRGMEFLFQAGGTLLAGALISALGTRGNLLLAGTLMGAGLVIFWALYRERDRKPEARPTATRLRDLFSWDMHRNLKVITVSFFIFNIGMWTSHSFIMPLFFTEKFEASRYTVSWVLMLHRLTAVLPLMLIGRLHLRYLKAAYMLAWVVEGLILSGSALIPNFHWAAAVWLLHDIVGGGVWLPVQNMVIQQYTRPDRRALELGKIQAYGGIGTIIGLWFSGVLSEQFGVSAPFFVGGLFITAAGISLVPLRLDRTAT